MKAKSYTPLFKKFLDIFESHSHYTLKDILYFLLVTISLENEKYLSRVKGYFYKLNSKKDAMFFQSPSGEDFEKDWLPLLFSSGLSKNGKEICHLLKDLNLKVYGQPINSYILFTLYFNLREFLESYYFPFFRGTSKDSLKDSEDYIFESAEWEKILQTARPVISLYGHTVSFSHTGDLAYFLTQDLLSYLADWGSSLKVCKSCERSLVDSKNKRHGKDNFCSKDCNSSYRNEKRKTPEGKKAHSKYMKGYRAYKRDKEERQGISKEKSRLEKLGFNRDDARQLAINNIK